MKKMIKLLGIIMIGVSAFSLVGCESKMPTKEEMDKYVRQNGVNACLDYYNEDIAPLLSKEEEKEARLLMYKYVYDDAEILDKSFMDKYGITMSARPVVVLSSDGAMADAVINKRMTVVKKEKIENDYKFTIKNNSKQNDIVTYSYVVISKDDKGNILKTSKPIKAEFKGFLQHEHFDTEIVKNKVKGACDIDIKIVKLGYSRLDYDNFGFPK